MKKNLRKFGSLVAILAIVLLAAHVVSVLAAVTPGGVGGWSWSSTIGWISASSTDSGAGGGPYQVVADNSGNLTGYMWSPNIGWIKFGGLASFPAAGSNAVADLSTGAVTGWARACAGTSGGDCSSMVSRSDGWDGWIELSGANHATNDLSGNGGVTMNTTSGAFVGYAWGGPVMGWIQFNTGGTTGVTLCPLGGCANVPITGNCTSAPTPSTNLAPNTTVTFTGHPTSGTGPYTYNWDGAGYAGSNSKAVLYSSTGAGSTVVIKDSLGSFSGLISCPAVTILQPLGASNLLIGRDITHATINSSKLNANLAFVLKWGATMTSDYSCTTNNTGIGAWNAWNSYSMPAGTDNGDGTMTWNLSPIVSLNTGSTPIGKYVFTITCTSSALPTPNPTQSASATLNVVKTSEGEI